MEKKKQKEHASREKQPSSSIGDTGDSALSVSALHLLRAAERTKSNTPGKSKAWEVVPCPALSLYPVSAVF